MSLTVKHNSGFFSCCSARLEAIINFIQSHGQEPTHIDSSHQFMWYKPNVITYSRAQLAKMPLSQQTKTRRLLNQTFDISDVYFNRHPPPTAQPPPTSIGTTPPTAQPPPPTQFTHEMQFTNYSNLPHQQLSPYITRYFSPTNQILSIKQSILDKYHLISSKTCTLFHRGNDKYRETQICPYDDYLAIAHQILKIDPTITFLLQSDESEFLSYMKTNLPNCTIFYDEIRHMPRQNGLVEHTIPGDNHAHSLNFLAITLIMAECKYIVCGSGNCSLWIVLFRGNTINVYQNLNGTWLHLPHRHLTISPNLFES